MGDPQGAYPVGPPATSVLPSVREGQFPESLLSSTLRPDRIETTEDGPTLSSFVAQEEREIVLSLVDSFQLAIGNRQSK